MKRLFFITFFFFMQFVQAGKHALALSDEEPSFAYSENQRVCAAQKKYIPMIESDDFFVSLEAYARLIAVWNQEQNPQPKQPAKKVNDLTWWDRFVLFFKVKKTDELFSL